MRVLLPNESGYITNWLTSGPKLTKPEVDFFDQNQLAFEKRLRGVIKDHDMTAPPEDIALGKPGLNGCPWKYYYAGSNWFIDIAIFYRLLTKVELYGYTEIYSETERVVPAHIGTFTASDLWVNGELVNSIDAPVYKPIHNEDFDIRLKEGKNEVFVRIQDLGVRDTRTIFGLKLKGDLTGITIGLPGDENAIDGLIDADAFLNSVTYKDGQLIADTVPACKVEVTLEHGERILWEGSKTFDIPADTKLIDLYATVEGEELHRDIELIWNVHPVYCEDDGKTIEEHRRAAIEALAEEPYGKMNGGFPFGVYNVIARYATGKNTDEDFDILLKDLDVIQSRIDCADFILNGMLRLFHRFEITDERVQARMKEVCQDFRYWMDEKGSDGMCFWSENHALLFYGCQMLAGKLYPDMLFTRSGRTGREQYETGARLCREWVASVLDTGFEEFLAGGYTCATTAALLNVIDFGPEDLKADAVKALDKLLRNVCKHTFKGCEFGPQGRVYRVVLYPYMQEVQALIHYINPKAPFAITRWEAGLSCTDYQIPDDFLDWMNNPVDEYYPCGNGEIKLLKKKDYILTSLASPKIGTKGWSNEALIKEDPYKTGFFTNMYTKSLNEKFHGTTLFEPGVYGYQQHFWYAALDPETLVFANHPGGTHDHCSVRPGYWNGNGLMPAQKQIDNVLGSVYNLRDEHPVNFTHVYWPAQSFDEEVREGGWLFGRKGDGYVAVWCNTPYTPHNDVLIDRELRNYGKEIAYVVVCGAQDEDGSFEGFMQRAKALDPVYDTGTKTLKANNGLEVVFIEKHNYSQYI